MVVHRAPQRPHGVAVAGDDRERHERRDRGDERLAREALPPGTGAEEARERVDEARLQLGAPRHGLGAGGVHLDQEEPSERRVLDDRVVVSPPGSFGGRTVPMSVRARQLPNRVFRDRADLRDAFANAREVMLSGEAVDA